ncbi:MATE family efflux transporter [Vallitalea longa]|uniref:Multidrug export protein MepA n=1 Tax=Vallitalea longa TaxID=2936439 RepID=A0A9W6DE92_9FIRM|nr:MATE family efflux transporter [Vallitalea longa]GKX29911.1 MATE family efflux transporter [Vallitalea longa]
MKQLDLGKDKVSKLFINYSVPAVISMVVISLYIIVDGIFVSRGVGPDGLAAVNIALPFIQALNSIIIMITIGGGVLTAIKLGENNEKEASRRFSFTVMIAVIFIIITSLISIIFLDTLVQLLGADESLIHLVKEYLVIMLSCNLLFQLSPIMENFIRIDGRPSFCMVVSIIGTIINIVLDYILVIKLNMGLTGAAIATCVGAGLSGIAMMTYFFTKKANLKFTKPAGNFRILGKMLYNGCSEFLTEISSSIVLLIFNIVIMKRMGPMGVSAISIVLYITTLIIMILFGISQSLQPIVSYNLGAGQVDRAKKGLKLCLITAQSISMISMVIVFIFSEPLVGIFAKGNKELIDMGVWMSRLYITSYIFIGFNITSSAFFTAIEQPLMSAVISLSRSLVLVIIGLIILPRIIGDSGIFVSNTFAEVGTFFVSIYYLKKYFYKKIDGCSKNKIIAPINQ